MHPSDILIPKLHVKGPQARENMNLLDLEKVGDLQLHGHCVLQDILVLLSSGLTIFLSGGAKLAHPPQKLALWALER